MRVTHAVVDENSSEMFVYLDLPDGGKVLFIIPKQSNGGLMLDSVHAQLGE
jgi:hypothetical protein